MGEVHLYHIPDESLQDEQLTKKEPYPIENAIWLSTKFSEFAKSIQLNSESGVLVLSLDDGPIRTMKLLEQIKFENFIDKIVPLYISVGYGGEDGPINCGFLKGSGPAGGDELKNPAGVSVFNEGQDGLPLLTSFESLLKVNREKQSSMNAQYNLGKQSTIQQKLDVISKDTSLDLGYVSDTSKYRVTKPNFINSLMNVRDVKEEEEKVKKYFETFLESDEFRSPLRSTEQIRAGILGIVDSYYSNEGVDITLSKSKLRDALDNNIYKKVAKESDMSLDESNIRWKDNRNDITEILINQLASEGVIEKDGKIIKKGKQWGTYNARFIQAYIKYYGKLINEQ